MCGASARLGASRLGGRPVPVVGGASAVGANMGCMGAPRNKAWAQRQVAEQGGRPHRMTVWCLLVGLDERAWSTMTRERQEERLRPFMVEGERIHWSGDGEAFIVPIASGGMGQGEDHDLSLDELKSARLARAHWSQVAQKLTAAAFQEAYTMATLDMAPKYVALENLVLDRAMADDATPAERRMGMSAWKDFKDRHMGKAVARIEDVSTKGSDIADWIAQEPPSTLPLSASWTVESVGEDQRLALEAGEIVGDE